MLPTVIILAYFHGRKHKKGWHKVEIIGLPVNIIVVILILAFSFKGKDLGAATTLLTVENEDGEKIERTVIKDEFRSKLMLYFYENKSTDTSLYWLQYSLPGIIDYDISQNIFLQVNPAHIYLEKLRESGYPAGIKAPLMLVKEIALYYKQDYFTTGYFDYSDGMFSVTTKLYESKNGRLVSEFEFQGNNIFDIIDEISVQLSKKMDIPLLYRENANDYPISEIYSNSMKAIEYFSKGAIEILLNNNWEQGIRYKEMAVEEDPGFVVVQINLAENYFQNNQVDKVKESLQKTMELMYKLPERLQFQVKFFYYIIEQEPDKAMAVLKMWASLYPYDIEAHELLAIRYYYKNMLEETI